MKIWEKLKWPLALTAAGLINLLVFGWAPILSSRDWEVDIEREPTRAVSLANFQPSPNLTPSREQKEKVSPPPKPKPDFEINPKIDQGSRVEKPEPEPERKKPPKPEPEKKKPEPEPKEEEVAKLKSPASRQAPEQVEPASAGKYDKAPRLVKRKPPAYPGLAWRKGITGHVVVRMLVDTRGHVQEVNIVSASPPGVFDKSVQQAVRKWKFDPGQLGENPVSLWVTQQVFFRMPKK